MIIYRFLLILLPLFTCLASYGLNQIYLSKNKLKNIILILICAVALVTNLKLIVYESYYNKVGTLQLMDYLRH